MRALVILVSAPLAIAGGAAPVSAQTISGRLLEVGSQRSIQAGLVLMVHEDGDTLARSLTGKSGEFELSSDRAGVYSIVARALGYRSVQAGGFELGEQGSFALQVALEPRPLELEELVVGFNRPILNHPLVRNGFVDRFAEGFGVFLTPVDIEQSSSTSTVDLFRGLPGVTVRPPLPNFTSGVGGGGTLSYVGDQVYLQAPGGWCVPTIYLDDARIRYDGDTSLDALLGIGELSGIEIYRRASEVPVKYNSTRSGGQVCGVIVIWTKQGR